MERSLLSSSQPKKRKSIFNNQLQTSAKCEESLGKSQSFVTYSNKSLNDTRQFSSVLVPTDKQINVIPEKMNSSIPRIRMSFSQPKNISSRDINPHIIYEQRQVPFASNHNIRNHQPQIIFSSNQNIQPIKFVHQQPAYNNVIFNPAPQLMPGKVQVYQAQPIQPQPKVMKQSIKSIIRQPIQPIIRQQPIIRSQTKEQTKIQQPMIKVTPPKENENFTITHKFDSAYSAVDRVLKEFCQNQPHNYNSQKDQENEQIAKLNQINSLLSENYNILYEHFFNLKNDLKTEEVVLERQFLTKSVKEIESIFSCETNNALNQIDQIYRRGGRKNTLKKSTKRIQVSNHDI